MLAERSIFRDFWLEERGAGHGVVMVVFKTAFPIFGKLGVKQVGPTEGRKPRVCMNHTSYHLHVHAHIHVVYK
jgi:hypothetical protein